MMNTYMYNFADQKPIEKPIEEPIEKPIEKPKILKYWVSRCNCS